MHSEERSKIINKIAFVTIITNASLSILKLVAGVFAHSQAVLSDGVDSLGDVLLTTIVLIGVNLGKKSKDDNHPYGHEKLESISSIILSMILFATAVGIAIRGINSISRIAAGEEIQMPLMFALIAAVVSIIAKEVMFRYAKKAAEITKSTALLADAWNFRSDAVASIGSLIGTGGAMLGIRVLDPMMSIIIALLIVRIAFKICITGINEVTDHAADKVVQQKLYDTIAIVKGVWFIDELKTRLHGNRLIVDIAIAVDGNMSVEDAHNIADKVSEAIYSCEIGVKECMVHVNPYNEKE